MKIKKIVAATIAPLAFTVIASNASAACSEAAAPEMPNPETAVIAEMVKAQKEVKKYLAAQEKFLKCTKSGRKHDAAVDNMHAIADKFNAVTREYKARMQVASAG